MAVDKQVTCYRYRLMHPNDWGPDCDDELRKQTLLWNRLVEIDRAHIERVRRVGVSDPAAEQAELERQAANDRYAEIERAIKDARKRAHKKIPTFELDAQLAVARVALQEATGRAKETRRAAYAANKEQLRALDDQRLEAVKKARQESGLWWCNYNAVVESYETGRYAARKRGGELRFTGWRGDGRLTNQIQGGITPKTIRNGIHSQVKLGPPPEGTHNRGGRRGARGRELLTLTVTAYTKRTPDGLVRRNVSWPIILDRPLPEDSRTKMVVVKKERVGPTWIWTASFTIEIPKPVATDNGPRVAVNLGWRKTNAGLRVATIAREGEEPKFIHMPDTANARIELCEKHQRLVDLGVQGMRGWLATLPPAPAPELAEEIGGIFTRKVLTPRHFWYLKRAWEQFAPDWEPEKYKELGDYLHAQQQYWFRDASRRKSIEDARKKHYEREAIRLLRDAREVIINDHDMSESAKSDDLPTPVQANRVIVAPYIMRNVIGNLCRRTGKKLTLWKGAHNTCSYCGEPLIVADRAQLWWTCRHCHNVFDQDSHFCRLMLSTDPTREEAAADTPPKRVSRVNRKSTKGHALGPRTLSRSRGRQKGMATERGG